MNAFEVFRNSFGSDEMMLDAYKQVVSNEAYLRNRLDAMNALGEIGGAKRYNVERAYTEALNQRAIFEDAMKVRSPGSFGNVTGNSYEARIRQNLSGDRGGALVRTFNPSNPSVEAGTDYIMNAVLEGTPERRALPPGRTIGSTSVPPVKNVPRPSTPSPGSALVLQRPDAPDPAFLRQRQPAPYSSATTKTGGGLMDEMIGKGKDALGKGKGALKNGLNNADEFFKRPGVAKAAGALGKGATVLGTAYTAYDMFNQRQQAGQDMDDTIVETAAGTLGNLGGSALGAKIGAGLGTLVAPGIGTLIGGGIGLVGGALLGQKVSAGLADWGWDFVDGDTDDGMKSAAELASEQEIKEWEADLGRLSNLNNEQLRVAREMGLLNEELSSRAAQRDYAYNQALLNSELEQRLYSDSLSTLSNINNAQAQMFANIYG